MNPLDDDPWQFNEGPSEGERIGSALRAIFYIALAVVLVLVASKFIPVNF